MSTFKELGLNHDLLNSLADLEFTEPSPVQEKAIPFILKSKKDLIALAQTGTGKTAAFGLPILNQLKFGNKELQAIILCPTRELCLQITQDIEKFAKYSKGVSVTAVYGGTRIDLQINALRRGTNIVVGTPGRVHDLIRRKVLKLQTIKWLVLDEADEMLDMGFKDDLDAILKQTPSSRQTLLFSATISSQVNAIAKNYMNEAEEISIGEKNSGADMVSHEYYVVSARDRFEALKRILDYLPGVYGILFCRTRQETQDVADKLKMANYETEALHGDVSQTMRTKIMDRFRRQQISLLVATDVAARGIDVNNLSHVINYNLPDQNGSYTHRSGRTGRAKKSGIAISILSPSELRRIKELERLIGKNFEYKKIPQGEEIYLKQLNNFIEEIEQKSDLKINQKHFLEIADRLKKLSKEDLIKYLIDQKFNQLLDADKNFRDLNVSAKMPTEKRYSRNSTDKFVSLKINFGKKNGLDIRGLFELINSNKHIHGIVIGKITLLPESSIFCVEQKMADAVIKCLSNSTYKGKRLIITKSNLSMSIRENNRNRSNRNFKHRR